MVGTARPSLFFYFNTKEHITLIICKIFNYGNGNLSDVEKELLCRPWTCGRRPGCVSTEIRLRQYGNKFA